MRPLATILVLTVMCAATAFGQKPDFTGTWKEISRSERVHIEKIEHQEPSLKVNSVSRDVPTGSSSLQRPLAMLMGEAEYRTDGAEQLDTGANGRQRWRTVGWQGSALVFLTVVKDGYRVTVTRESWTLSDSGERLTKAIRMVDMDGVTESNVTFQRQ
jgi:hypothetical protein